MTSYADTRDVVGRPAAWWGMLILIASESTLFGCFIGSYYYLRFRSATWPPHGIPEPKLVVPLILLAVLLTTVVPMRLAAKAAATGRLAATRLFLALALVVQSGYFAYEVHDFSDQLHGFDITRDAYSSIYYTLLGAAHTHVAAGILMSMWLVLRLVTGLTRYRLAAVRAIAFYWYAVAVIGVVVALCLAAAAL